MLVFSDQWFLCRHPWLRWCYQVVFSVSFEYFMYVLILLNIFPISLELANTTQYDLELQILNYIFCVCYVFEAIFKVRYQW